MTKGKNKKTSDSAKRVLSEWWDDAVNLVLDLHFPFLKLAKELGKRGYAIIHDKPRVMTREELYRAGLRMLESGDRSIVAVNTVGREDSLNVFIEPGHMSEKEYYEQLYRIVQGNHHGVGRHLSVLRYMDLGDVNKCEEAISRLIYGGDIEIFDAPIQIEFLIRDDQEVLLGFAEERELSHGIGLTNEGLADALNKWIASKVKTISVPGSTGHGAGRSVPARFGKKNLTEMAEHIRKRRDELNRELPEGRKKVINPDSLINAVALLDRMGIEDLFDATAKAFDSFKHWYPNLYDEEQSNYCYKSLAKLVNNDLFRGRKPTLLDCGCAHGLGANVLSGEGIEYWGVDASPELIEIAKSRSSSKSFIVGDIVRVLLDREARAGDGRRLPRRFDVIACQGNTFDFFLGEPQKWFMLALFRSRLNRDGILFLTQRSFRPEEPKVERKLPLGNEGHTV